MTTLSEALAPRSDQLNADDLIAGPRTLKLTGGKITSDGRQQRMTLSYEGDQGKPFKPCKTMGRAMVMIWKLTDEGFAEQVKGKSIRVYRDPEVSFGDQGQIGGVRISHMSHVEKATSIKLTVSQGKKSIFTFHPMPIDATETQSKPRQTAEEWAADHLGFVTGAADIARLDAVEASGTKAMAKLATSNADLHASVVAAYASRRAELTDDDEPFAEGRATTDHGDQHTDDDALGIADQLIERVNAAKLIADVLAIETEYQSVGRDMLEVADQDRVEAAIDAAKVAMKGAGK